MANCSAPWWRRQSASWRGLRRSQACRLCCSTSSLHLAAWSRCSRAAGLMAGLGVQFWPILQDLTQLRAVYGAQAGTFLANAGLIQAVRHRPSWRPPPGSPAPSATPPSSTRPSHAPAASQACYQAAAAAPPKAPVPTSPAGRCSRRMKPCGCEFTGLSDD